jgi:hypothetical protein
MAHDPVVRRGRHRGWSGAVVSLVIPVLTSIAASSIMALMVMLGGEMIERSALIMVATPTDPDPDCTRVATDACSLLVLEANAPGSVTLPCWLSDRPNAIVAPCRR